MGLCNEYVCVIIISAYRTCSTWSKWNNCTGTCGIGRRSRTRLCAAYSAVVAETYQGQVNQTIVTETESEICDMEPCDLTG